jgi:hypothetical protein
MAKAPEASTAPLALSHSRTVIPLAVPISRRLEPSDKRRPGACQDPLFFLLFFQVLSSHGANCFCSHALKPGLFAISHPTCGVSININQASALAKTARRAIKPCQNRVTTLGPQRLQPEKSILAGKPPLRRPAVTLASRRYSCLSAKFKALGPNSTDSTKTRHPSSKTRTPTMVRHRQRPALDSGQNTLADTKGLPLHHRQHAPNASKASAQLDARTAQERPQRRTNSGAPHSRFPPDQVHMNGEGKRGGSTYLYAIF